MSKMWSDAPIKSAVHDSFGRGKYAQQIANLIDSAGSGDDSIVFGLTGPWGSGKSSMLAMIEEALEDQESSWHIARFTPWATSDINGLFADFHASLSDALPDETSQKLKKSFGALMQASAPFAKLIPVAGESMEAAAKLAADALLKQPSWNKSFQKVSNELKTQTIRVLVITDDIDRLHGDELLALLKVVRLLGRFPGVHFLLAYDEETIAETIAQSGIAGDNNTGRRFMEKIVQYPLPISPLTPTQLLGKLDDGLFEYVEKFHQPDHFKMRMNALRGPLLSILSTPRSIERFLAQLRHTMEMFDFYEVELGDVILLTLLKTSFPSVFNELPRYKHQLISGMRNGKKRGFLEKDQEEFNLDVLLQLVPDKYIEDALQLIQDLFPAFRNGVSRYWMQPAEKSISKVEYFDRYFVMGVPDYDVSDAVVAEAVNSAAVGEIDLIEGLLAANDTEKIGQVVDKAERFSMKLEGDDKLIQILRSIFPQLETLPRNEGSVFSADYRIRGWGTMLLARLSDDVNATKVKETFALVTNHRDQIEIMKALLPKTEGKPWLNESMELVIKNIVDVLIQNLTLRDKAPINFEMWYFLSVLWDWEQLDPLRTAIRNGLDNNDFTEVDVAARCVEYSYGAPNEPLKARLIRFSDELFEAILPDSSISRVDELPENFDAFDLSWKNRGSFAKSLKSSTHKG